MNKQFLYFNLTIEDCLMIHSISNICNWDEQRLADTYRLAECIKL